MKKIQSFFPNQCRLVLCLGIVIAASQAYAQCFHMKYASSACYYPCDNLNKHMCDYHNSQMTESERAECGCPSNNNTSGTSTGTTSGSGVQDAILNGVQGALTQGMTTFFTNTLFKPKPKLNQQQIYQQQQEQAEYYQQMQQWHSYTDSLNMAEVKNLKLSKQELEERKQKKQKECENMLAMLTRYPEYWPQWKDYMKLNCGVDAPQSQAAELAKMQLAQKVTQRFLERDTAMERKTKNAMHVFNEKSIVVNLKQDWQVGWGVSGGGSPVVGLKEGWPASPRLKIEENTTVPDLTKEQLEMLRQEREKKHNEFTDYLNGELQKADYAAADLLKKSEEEIKNIVNTIEENPAGRMIMGGIKSKFEIPIPSQLKPLVDADKNTKAVCELISQAADANAYKRPEQTAEDVEGSVKLGFSIAGLKDYYGEVQKKWLPSKK